MIPSNVRPVLFAALALGLPASASAQITIDGDFSDFDDSTIVYQDDGTGTGQFITDIRVTNDNDNIFVNYNYSQPAFAAEIPIFTGFDVDQAPLIVRADGQTVPSTGFNFFGAGLGVEAAFQADFPFQSVGDGTNELFNANNQVIPAQFFGGDGVSRGGLKNPDGTPAFGTFSNTANFGPEAVPSTGVEFAFSAAATLGDGTPIFTFGEEFGITVGFTGFAPSNGTGVFTPTPVVIPEPATLAALGLGSLALLGRRRSA